MTTMLTVRQAAKILNVHPNTLRRLDQRGQLKAHRMGNVRGDRRFNEDDLYAFADAYAYKS